MAMDEPRIAIIGAGAAGMMAAGTLHEAGLTPFVYETRERPGRKLGITGKGRCNLTNNCAPDEVIANVPTNPRFLYGAVNAFAPRDTMALFERLGVPLKTERGNRVFPCSDKARDIVDALAGYMGVRPLNRRVISLTREDGDFVIDDGAVKRRFDRVIIATGGVSYPVTGSRGDGYGFARGLGHTIVEPQPSLVPLETVGGLCQSMQGLSLRNVGVSVKDMRNGKSIYTDFGEMMFTHFGVTGPVILSASSHMRSFEPGRWRIEIDLKPALDRDKLDARLRSDFEKYSNRDFANALGDLLPQAMIAPFIKLSGVELRKKVNSVTKEERRAVLELLKCFPAEVREPRPIEEAIVTSGGVSTKEIDPKTMQSKLVPGLYFAGEVIDVDAYTGGFNLQIAFSTAVSAARNLIKEFS